VVVINPGLGDKLLCKNIDSKFQLSAEESVKPTDDTLLAKWSTSSKKEQEIGLRLKIEHKKVSFSWEFFTTVK
jgi:hypothetical protein